ncbi:hypothetical protein Xmau_04329 [Xenorhabdus mauleonii]|uniref:Uncharacterized protein n=1 Tax=Xenorhabdus mauleonii TaxID=351675 RepID=A0A1I3XIA0_9GAMM|nr:hypothetical protein Xmau_04329 [Xenorhabdus mauleonii]SFK19245.1 hypothetical protein SAMN05421680_13527 [Xenorhabdus mauleonii]
MSFIPTPVELNRGKVKFGKFLVRPLRKNVLNTKMHYQVDEGDNCHGLFESRYDAIRYCQRMYRIKIHERIKEDATQI